MLPTDEGSHWNLQLLLVLRLFDADLHILRLLLDPGNEGQNDIADPSYSLW